MRDEGAPAFWTWFSRMHLSKMPCNGVGKEGLICKTEECKDIYYAGKFVGSRRLDLLVEDKVLVELKAVADVDKIFSNQVLNYLRVFDMEVGLLLNFGRESLYFKRYIHSKRT